MTERFDHKGQRTTSDFEAAAFLDHSSLVKLAKHLARISATNDYKDFLNSQHSGYNLDSRKGPGS